LRFSVAGARRNVLPGEVFAPAIVQADGTITARLYRDELATLGADEHAEFVPSATPDAIDRPVKVQRDAREPAVHATLADVVFRPQPGAAPPSSGQVGWVKLSYKTRDMLVVRASSVIQSTDGPYVLVFSAKLGTLTRRKVEVGKEWEGMTAIVGGLRDKEFVVMGDTFSFDAERRQQAAP
jgi:multidrug efflux pump subunit AcrA (membrane-fusion protein)